MSHPPLWRKLMRRSEKEVAVALGAASTDPSADSVIGGGGSHAISNNQNGKQIKKKKEERRNSPQVSPKHNELLYRIQKEKHT
jgi:hypothetical protein